MLMISTMEDEKKLDWANRNILKTQVNQVEDDLVQIRNIGT